jgi:hypothetical protein
LTVIFLVFLLAFNIAIQYSRWPALQWCVNFFQSCGFYKI